LWREFCLIKNFGFSRGLTTVVSDSIAASASSIEVMVEKLLRVEVVV
jgi:hypothetical protein